MGVDSVASRRHGARCDRWRLEEVDRIARLRGYREVGPRQFAPTSVILCHESVFSGLSASFVKRQAFKPLNRCAPFKPFKPTSALRVQSSNTLYPAAVNRFWIPTE